MNKRHFVEYLYFTEAFILLHLSRIIILFIPFKKIAEKLGKINVETCFESEYSEKIIHVQQAIQRASHFTVHTSKCYDKALAAKVMLRNRGLSATIYFGLAKDSKDELIAHAWVRSGDKIVTGKDGMDRFNIIASFGDLANKHFNK